MHDELGEALDEQQLRKLLEQCTVMHLLEHRLPGGLEGVTYDEVVGSLDEQQLRQLLEQCTANEFAKMGWTSPPPLQAKTVGKMGRVAPAPAPQAMCDAAVAGASGMQWPWKLVARRVRNRGRALAPLHWTSRRDRRSGRLTAHCMQVWLDQPPHVCVHDDDAPAGGA